MRYLVNKISDAIAIKLHSIFGDGYKYCSEKIEQNFMPGTFLIINLLTKKKELLYTRNKWSSSFIIQYFPKDELAAKQECNDIAFQMANELDFVETVEGNVLHGINMNWEIVDDVLQFTVSYAFYTYQEDDADMMEELEIIQQARR